MRADSTQPPVVRTAENARDTGLKALKACCAAVVLMLMAQTVAVSGDCREGCKALSRNGHFQIMAMPAQGGIELRKHHDWILKAQDADGNPVTLDGLSVTGGMLGHGHGLPSQPRVTEYLGDGRYRLTGFLFNMHGDWTLRFHLVRQGVQDVAELTFTLDY